MRGRNGNRACSTLLELPGYLLEVLGFLQDALDDARDLLTRSRQTQQPLSPPHKDLQAQFILQIADVLAYARLRGAQRVGCLGQVEVVPQRLADNSKASAILESEADVGVATDTLDEHAGIVAFPYHTWEHALVVPHGHPLTLTKTVTLEKISSYPIITYDEGLTGRSRIDAAFEAAGAVPDFAMSALDSDVIKAYVEYGLGVGIIASMAYDAARDTQLALIRCDGVFRPSTSSIAVRHGKPLRKYVYSFIEMCTLALTEATIRKAQSKA